MGQWFPRSGIRGVILPRAASPIHALADALSCPILTPLMTNAQGGIRWKHLRRRKQFPTLISVTARPVRILGLIRHGRFTMGASPSRSTTAQLLAFIQ